MWFLKIFLSKMISQTSCNLSRSNRTREGVQPLHVQTPFMTVIFKTLGLIRLSRSLSYTNHESGKFHSFHVQSAWQYNWRRGPDYTDKLSSLALPRSLLSRPGITWKGPARRRHFYIEVGRNAHEHVASETICQQKFISPGSRHF